uniref:Uncharacterized protein n=1 Tax=Fundulus heteroclitus TaxID=8078 RepID=A0A3Q2PYG8_FUNHE
MINKPVVNKGQEEPLYDFPEPTQPSKPKLLGPQRGRGSLRSISVLDRLLLTVPVWLQLSINPANALHILQRDVEAAKVAACVSACCFCLSEMCYLSLWSFLKPLQRQRHTKSSSPSPTWELVRELPVSSQQILQPDI